MSFEQDELFSLIIKATVPGDFDNFKRKTQHLERASCTHFISCAITGCAFKEEFMICKEPIHERLAILCLKNFDGIDWFVV